MSKMIVSYNHEDAENYYMDYVCSLIIAGEYNETVDYGVVYKEGESYFLFADFAKCFHANSIIRLKQLFRAYYGE